MLKKTLLFLVINFGLLAVSGYFTRIGVPSDWHQNLNRAPWTPPGWMFGTAWSLIMLTYSIYMAMLLERTKNKVQAYKEYIVQTILNVSWTPLFFLYHKLGIPLLDIVLLTLTMGYVFFKYIPTMRYYSLLVLPYFLWLLIATSLNGYAFWYN